MLLQQANSWMYPAPDGLFQRRHELKIDIFNRVMPKRYCERLNQVASNLGDPDRRMRSIPILVDMEARVSMMEEIGPKT